IVAALKFRQRFGKALVKAVQRGGERDIDLAGNDGIGTDGLAEAIQVAAIEARRKLVEGFNINGIDKLRLTLSKSEPDFTLTRRSKVSAGIAADALDALAKELQVSANHTGKGIAALHG